RRASDGVVVVSDGNRVLEPVENSGDEPQMLARALPGVPVLVCADRHLAGRLAEKRFAATVMLLDDGFQHLALGRNVDVLVMPASDLDDAVLPSGRLREPLDAASSADCVLVPGSLEDVSRVAATFDRMPVFRVTNHFGTVQGLDASAPSGTRVVAVAGIARPERFFTTLREQGFEIVRELRFPDHHWFSSDDLDRIRTIAKDASADFVATTEKDAVRVAPQSGWAVLPMTAVIEPPELFSSWLRERL
ncbi:MAG TPA: tetraacyldisaccharide 4'-kinase, partial [Vicinamibacterales bacterium]|nr:tetraacyldisaccharide 4'-kinase [Vicinamibacterales bacterium]